MLNFQIYLDMAVMVDAQGEVLDNIESQVCLYKILLTPLHSWTCAWIVNICSKRMCIVDENIAQVSSTVDHVQRGNSALQNAKKLQKNSRKWTCIAIIILLIIVAIIVVSVFKPWKNGKGAWGTWLILDHTIVVQVGWNIIYVYIIMGVLMVCCLYFSYFCHFFPGLLSPSCMWYLVYWCSCVSIIWLYCCVHYR